MSSRVRIFWVWLEGQFWKLRMTLPASLLWKICSLPRIFIISCHTCLCFVSRKLWYILHLNNFFLFVKLWLVFSSSCIHLLYEYPILYSWFLRLCNLWYSGLRISFLLDTTLFYTRRLSCSTHLTLWNRIVSRSTGCFKHRSRHTFCREEILLWRLCWIQSALHILIFWLFI